MDNIVSFMMAREGIGPSELARRAGVSRNTVQRLLRKENASPDTMFRIARVFGKNVEDVFFIKTVLHVEQENNQKKSA